MGKDPNGNFLHLTFFVDKVAYVPCTRLTLYRIVICFSCTFQHCFRIWPIVYSNFFIVNDVANSNTHSSAESNLFLSFALYNSCKHIQEISSNATCLWMSSDKTQNLKKILPQINRQRRTIHECIVIQLSMLKYRPICIIIHTHTYIHTCIRITAIPV